MANAGLGLGGWRVVTICVAACVASAPLRAQLLPADSAKPDSMPATLIGHVVDTSGVGVSGAEITLNKSDKVHAITGDSGEFRIVGLPGGPCNGNRTVTCRSEGRPGVTVSRKVLDRSHYA